MWASGIGVVWERYAAAQFARAIGEFVTVERLQLVVSSSPRAPCGAV